MTSKLPSVLINKNCSKDHVTSYLEGLVYNVDWGNNTKVHQVTIITYPKEGGVPDTHVINWMDYPWYSGAMIPQKSDWVAFRNSVLVNYQPDVMAGNVKSADRPTYTLAVPDDLYDGGFKELLDENNIFHLPGPTGQSIALYHHRDPVRVDAVVVVKGTKFPHHITAGVDIIIVDVEDQLSNSTTVDLEQQGLWNIHGLKPTIEDCREFLTNLPTLIGDIRMSMADGFIADEIDWSAINDEPRKFSPTEPSLQATAHVGEQIDMDRKIGDSILDRLDKGKRNMFLRKVKRYTLWILAILAVILGGVAYGVSKLPDPLDWKYQTKYVSDYRDCTIMFPDDTTLTGTRTYTYTYNQIFGYRWYSTDAVKEETTIRVNSTGLLVAGHGGVDQEPEIKQVKHGEITNLTLGNYPQYTFTLNGMMMVLKYKSICR